MKTIAYLTVLFLALLAACTDQPGQQPLAAVGVPQIRPRLDPALQGFLDEFDRYFRDSMMLTLTPGAAVVVVKDSQVVFLKGYGTRAEGSHLPVDANTVFRVGSLSKGFAGVLAAMVEAEGKFSWYDKVQRYVPDFDLKDPAQAQRLEVRHLLTQTTGLPYHSFSNLIEQGYGQGHILPQYRLARLGGKEGEYFSYQNAAFCLIEPVLEQATGRGFGQLLAERIFQPLGMASASCTYEGIASSPNVALPHRYRGGFWVADSITHRYYNFPAAGGVNASATDMGQWLLALLGQRPAVLPKAVLDDVFKPAIATGLERPVLRGFIDRDSAHYAKGWRILHHWGDTLVYHAGFVNNFHCEIALNRRDGLGICVLFNSPSTLAGDCISRFYRRWRQARAVS
jgi:beta-lactamase class C